MKRQTKESYRHEAWGVIKPSDSARPSKTSKRFNPKRNRPNRKKEKAHESIE
jgi:hypothetical protein